jgi:hypothetical protein
MGQRVREDDLDRERVMCDVTFIMSRDRSGYRVLRYTEGKINWIAQIGIWDGRRECTRSQVQHA